LTNDWIAPHSPFPICFSPKHFAAIWPQKSARASLS
jgi:hypothetical protein